MGRDSRAAGGSIALTAASKPPRKKKKIRWRKAIPVYIMLLPALVYFLINNYLPMYGITIAFRKLDYAKGILRSPFNGFDNFKFLFASGNLGPIVRNTILYMLRQRKEFDQKRIALVGGSAGAYMTLMLMGQNLGLCAAVANGPVVNVYFNFNYYWPMAQALNLQALGRMMEEEKAQADRDGGDEENPALILMKKLAKVPIPFIAALMGSFEPVRKNFPEGTDAAKWEAVTGVGIAGQFCNPLMVNHSTSDILVPVDQISRRYTYEKPGDSLPENFNARLPKNFPGKLKCSLEECLPEEETRVLRIPVPEEAGEESVLPYGASKRFNLNIFDDGPVEGYGSHSSRMDVGRRIDLPYLREMFGKTAAETNVLTPQMLRFQIDLYQGNSLALPAHIGADDRVYGSLAVYREKVCVELGEWIKCHGLEGLRQAGEAMLSEKADDGKREALKTSLEEIIRQVQTCTGRREEKHGRNI